jgi:hypothetical protein
MTMNFLSESYIFVNQLSQSKERIFLGPQTGEVTRDTASDKTASGVEKQHREHLEQWTQFPRKLQAQIL